MVDRLRRRVRRCTIGRVQPKDLFKILVPRWQFLALMCVQLEILDFLKRDHGPTFRSSLLYQLRALDREIVTSLGMEKLHRKVDAAVTAVDKFIKFLGMDGPLRAVVDVLRPSEIAICCQYVGFLSKSLTIFSDPIQEAQQTSYAEQLIKVMRARVLELINEIEPSPLTDPGTPSIYEKYQVFYTTDRPLAKRGYSGIPKPSGTLHYGEMVVSMPRDHRRGGNLEEPLRTDPQIYTELVVRICEEKKFFGCHEEFFRELNVYINEKASCPDVLIFIPGFKSVLEESVQSLAKLKKDLEFEGAVILYSWTSAGEVQASHSDEKTVRATTSLLCDFILDIQDNLKLQIASPRHPRPSRIHLMAHSMGNRALIGALRRLQDHVGRPLIGREDLPNISQVVFSAADVKMADFIGLVEGFRSYSQDAKIPILTVYCTKDDIALMLSDMIKCNIRKEDYARLGTTQSCIDSSDKLGVHFVDVVDATGLGTSTLNHSYYCEAPTVLDDLKDIFQGGQRAADRERPQQLNIPRAFKNPFIMYTFNPGLFPPMWMQPPSGDFISPLGQVPTSTVPSPEGEQEFSDDDGTVYK